jgi:hypothetical protein
MLSRIPPNADGAAPGAVPRRLRLARWLAIAACLLFLPAPAALAQNTPPTKPGFPLVINESPTNQVAPIGSQAVAADLGLTSGFKSIVFGLRNGKLFVVRRNSNGSWGVAPGWPQQLPAHIYSSPAVADLNNDSQPDVVVGYGSTIQNQVAPAHGGARAYRRDGAPLWEVFTMDVTPGPADGFRDPVMSTPAIGDVNGDGQVDVVFGGLDHRLYVVNGATGASINGAVWPKDMGDTVFSSPALHDLDNDGRLEIIIGTDAFTVPGGRLRVLKFDGTDFPGFVGGKPIDQVVSSSPAVGDIDGDGQPEIVHGTGSFFTDANNGPAPPPLPRVYAWNCDGSAVAGWPVATSGQVITSPALANLDGDAPLEVVVTDSDPPGGAVENRVYAFNGNGSQIFSTVVLSFFNVSTNAGEPIVADVLGADSAPEILVPIGGEVAVFTSAGARLTETNDFPDDPAPNFMTQDDVTGVAVTDLETNGAGSQIEVIVVSGQFFPNQTQTVVHVWNPVARATVPLWGFFRQNERRLGVVPGTPSCGTPAACTPNSAAANFFTITPCRAVDTRNPNGPLGGPALSSGAPRTFAVGPTCGVPAAAKAVSVNVTVTQPGGGGFVRFGPGGCPSLPLVSTINFSAFQTRSNNAVLPLAVNGSGGLTAEAFVAGNGGVHLIIDVNGYFQ